MRDLARQGGNTNRAGRSSVWRAILIGILGAWLGVMLWGGVYGNIGIVTVHASLRPAIFGRTVLRIPPLGAVSARTHIGPARIDLSIDQVHIKETAEWLKLRKSPKQTAAIVEDGIKKTAFSLAGWAVVVAAVGAVAACVLFRLGRKRVTQGLIAGVLSVAVPLALAAATYRPAAFDNPSFEGEMARAPQLLDTAQKAWQSNAQVIQDLPRIANRTAALCDKLGQGRYCAQPQQYRVLVISDLHNNPIGAHLALDLAETYKVDLVLIDGDFTDLGHPLEAELLATLKRIQAPIVAVTGNHDSRATVAALQSVANMTVLHKGECVRECGLSIMGFDDPVSRRANTGSVNDSRSQLRALRSKIEHAVGRSQPDLLMVHNDGVAKAAAGAVSVIVDGHSHKADISYRGRSVVVNPGTTGAAGVRFFSDARKPAYTASVLSFAADRHPRLDAVDSIRMDMPSGDYCVTRRSVPLR